MKKNMPDALKRNFITAPYARFSAGRRAFTIIEVLTVVVFLSILSMAAIQSFEYSVRKEKEERLRGTLNSVRSAIDRYYLDRLAAAPGTAHEKRFPASLEELVSAKYLRAVPADPVTGEATWEIILVSKDEKRVFDLKSKARGVGLDNSLYSSW